MPDTYENVVERIERLVALLNDALGFSTEYDADFRRTCVTFGYIGNCSIGATPGTKAWFDERIWSVFLPHPGRVGTDGDRIGSFRTGDLDGAKACLAALGGALKLARWASDPTIPFVEVKRAVKI